MATCAHCSAEFDARAGARTCSTRCRVARHRASARFAPEPLRRADRWVRHIEKRPIQPSGKWASSTDQRTWSSFEAVRSVDVGDGVGFVLNGDGIVCVDLDGCVEDGRPNGWAEEILGLFPDAPVELSLSGRGLHVWGYGRVASRIFERDGGKVEVYSDKRYIAVTGRWLRPGPLVDLSAGLARMGC